MNLEHYTQVVRNAVLNAKNLAEERRNSEVEPLHLLYSLFQVQGSMVPAMFKLSGIEVGTFVNELSRRIDKLPKLEKLPESGAYISNNFLRVMRAAEGEAQKMGDDYISAEHLILALLSGDYGETSSLLHSAGLTKESFLSGLQKVRGSTRITDDQPESKFNVLERYGSDLTELARKGKLDPVIGRQEEIRRIIKILSRRTKNNPVLIGDPGVGKTAIVEGLAQKIIREEVPEGLKGKKIIALDIGSLVAGTKYRGEFEERIRAFIKAVQSAEGQIILFIDELHTIIGAGATGGALDAANMLKPALARGELRAIGATTIEEYRKNIEKDPALERRFAPILIEEPSVEDTISILRGLKEKYEVYHRVKFQDDALVAAVELSHRYITERYLPDKAIDLMDEAAANLRVEMDSSPKAIAQLDDEIRQLEIEKRALEKDKSAKAKLEGLKQKIKELKQERDRLVSHWEKEKIALVKIHQYKEELEQKKYELDKVSLSGELEQAAKLKYGVIPELESKIKEEETKLVELQQKLKLLKEEVTAEDIANVVSEWTGIPVSRLTEAESEKLLKLEEILSSRVVGQAKAIQIVSDVVRAARAGLASPDRPLGSFIFLGPTGVGKTELAKTLAWALFDTQEAIVRIDMSEYMEKFAVSRLIGSPPGYIGYEEGGQLTETIRRRPYAVVLFDEIEKAHPEVFNILLQVLDEGRLTDSKGHTANFRNTILIMTSNIGAPMITERLGKFSEDNVERAREYEKLRNELFELLRRTLPPEFLNRIDATILFNPLNREDMKQIAYLRFEELKKRLADQDISATLTEPAANLLAELGYDPVFGARPIRRAMETYLVQPIARLILRGELKAGGHLTIEAKDGKFEFEVG